MAPAQGLVTNYSRPSSRPNFTGLFWCVLAMQTYSTDLLDWPQGRTMTRTVSAKPVDPITADLGTIVGRAARRFGSKPALIAGERIITYEELDHLCERTAAGLLDLGVAPGDRVSLYSPNRWEWVVAYHAVLRVGAVVNPINVMLTAEEVAFVLNDCGASAVITSADKAETILGLTTNMANLRNVISFDAVPGGAVPFAGLLDSNERLSPLQRPRPEEVSTIGYTSGTTGHPKGAMQSHRAVFLNTAAFFAAQTRTEHDVMFNALPPPHVYSNVIMNGTFMAGATLVFMERFDPASALALIEAHRVTVFDGVPTMYMLMLADPALVRTDLSSLRICAVGGRPCPWRRPPSGRLWQVVRCWSYGA